MVESCGHQVGKEVDLIFLNEARGKTTDPMVSLDAREQLRRRSTMKICWESNGTQMLKLGGALAILLVSLVPAHGQRYEVTPLIGGMFGGTVKLEQQGVHNFDAHVNDRLSFGVAGGVRYDAESCEGCNLIEFRWLRQNTHLRLDQDPIVPTPVTASLFRPRVTFDKFLGDFSREWNLDETRIIKPFLSASLGAALMSTPAASTTRFVFGIGTGVKIFPERHWGFRFQVEYMPIVMHAGVQRVVCAVGCIVALGGGIMNQFQLSIGPAFRF
jgi:hypothetical protein